MTTQLNEHATGREDAAAGWYGAATGHVMLFLRSLRRLPASEWLRVTESSQRARAGADGQVVGDGIDPVLEEQLHHMARRRLYQALETMPQVVRRISDRINMELAVLEAFVPEVALQRMRRAAHLAAFAIAAQHLLPREDVQRLYRPFDAIVPVPEILAA